MAALAPLGTGTRPYRDYLTPSLHTRFIRASRYTILLCYVIACWMGEWKSLLWLWLPFGPTGIRTLLLFIPALTIYLLRIAQWHVGPRHTLTRAETFQKYFLRKNTILTLAFYTFSAWLYSEIYTWSRTEKDRLNITELGRAHERLKLNERPLYLRFLFMMLAAAQTGVHLWSDYDRIDVPAMQPKQLGGAVETDAPVKRGPKPRVVLVKQLQPMFVTAASLALLVTISGTIFYFIGPRHLLWEYYYSFSRNFISLSKTSKPTGLAPFAPLVSKFAMEGTLLVLLWEFVNKAFDLYIAQEPLKYNKPITGDSKDPNGTLLNGLKSNKEATKAMAFWELALITDAFSDRRKTIYAEMERKRAPTFQQVADFCLAEIKLLIDRLNVGLDPAYQTAAASAAPEPRPSVNLVPQISQPLKDDKQVVALPPKPSTKWEQFEATTSGIAKSHSSPGNSQQAYGREAINKGMKKAQEGAQQAEAVASTASTKILSSPFGYFFSHSLPRRAKLVVLGAPYSRISLICNAITALANLATFSIAEDSIGRFHESVPAIIRTFTQAINKIDAYMATLQVHWSDTDTLSKFEAEQKKVPEVDLVRKCLQTGLQNVLSSFEKYLGGMGMSMLEITDAKKAAAIVRQPEMMQTAAR
ncbi:nucleoporin protein Ndc1-Nup [Boeremia exigua]|uniref:nucleoporin protein Ndc1-Nup n=1 Tax=Boeremia exigua TaxID=749465 RepID=UPI001E8CBCEA|nr:nucleoporin protein Ndc1-Nup [Boeremia exigua]KAH6639458.1 nucleoporin protein Ndc1-Nup [Boeremia exigua]